MIALLKLAIALVPDPVAYFVLWLSIPTLAKVGLTANGVGHAFKDAATLMMGGTVTFTSLEAEFGAKALAGGIPGLMPNYKLDEAQGGIPLASVANIFTRAGTILLAKFPDPTPTP